MHAGMGYGSLALGLGRTKDYLVRPEELLLGGCICRAIPAKGCDIGKFTCNLKALDVNYD